MSQVLVEKVLVVAQSQVGVRETPGKANRGPEVDAYIKSVGLNPAGGYAWCQAFIYWCFQQAANMLNVPNPLLKTAGVLAHWNNTKARKIGVKQALAQPSLIEPGMIFVMDFGKGTGHIGFVERVDGATIHTIEGNTNDGGSREGIAVMRRQRTIASMKGFIDYS